MAQRHNHYEAAFEELLREERVPYVAVDERRRSLVGDGSLKSVDFLVSPLNGESLIIDIKGRRFPSGKTNKQYWRNWSTRDDLRSLASWAQYMGDGFKPLLVFAYEVVADRSPVPPSDLWLWGGRQYGFVAMPLADYWLAARTLSPRWETVSMPAAEFRQQAFNWRAWRAATVDAAADGSPARFGRSRSS